MTHDEITEGYIDGSQPDAIPPGPNRSAAYKHGWLNAQDDKAGKPRASAAILRERANRLRERADT